MTKHLVRHFLHRFVDNDIVSPNADSHEALALVGAALGSLGLFVTVFLSFKFFGYVPPGRSFVAALDDTALYIGGSMILMALLAVVEWDALSLDARDAAILGPLPVPHASLVRAKAAALAIFIAMPVGLMAAGPSVMHPFAIAQNLHAGAVGFLRLFIADAVSIVAAGTFGFISVLALRELLRVFLGSRLFERVSTLVQAILVVALATLLFLLPGAYAGVARSWLAPGGTRPDLIPPLWFVGLHERLLGHVLDNAPRPPWLRAGRALAAESQARALYGDRAVLFPHLANVAITALALETAIAAAAYMWNSRRLPAPGAPRRGRRTPFLFVDLTERFVAKTPASRAGFFFTLQCLGRSAPHRMAIATAMAAGFASGLASLHGIDLLHVHELPNVPVSLLAVQTLLLLALLGAFRHAIRLPADVRAAAVFHLAPMRDEAGYVRGVAYGAAIGLIAPTLVVLLAGFAWPLGISRAFALAACGGAVALMALEGMLRTVRRLPFASSYVPLENLKLMAPLYVVLWLASAYALAWISSLLLTSLASVVVFVASSLIGVVALRHVPPGGAAGMPRMVLDELPALPTQRLDLHRW